MLMTIAQIRGILLLVVLSMLTACSNPLVRTRSIKAAYDVKIRDANLRLFTNATAHVDLVASGDFKEGVYLIENKTITIAPQTQFRLNLSLPISEPDVIHTTLASGSLWTSHPISVNGFTAPQTVALSGGEVSGQVDLVRSLGAFLLRCLQSGGGEGGDVRQMVYALNVEQATFALRPDSWICFAQKRIHIGPQSSIAFRNVTIDHDLDYDGNFDANLTFLDGCQWCGQRSECDFDGGDLSMKMHAAKRNGNVNLTLIKSKKDKPQITLAHSFLQMGKNRNSSALSSMFIIYPAEMSWAFLKDNQHPQFHMRAPVELKRTRLDVKTDVQETVASFPGVVPAILQMDLDGSKRSVQFATTESANAESAKIVIAKKATSLAIRLSNATVGPASLDRSGAFQFALESGNAQLKELDWRASKGRFTLVAAPGCEVSIPSGMCLENANSQQTTQMNMPLNVSLGTATIRGASDTINLTDLNGKLMISVDKEVQITGDLGFRIPESSLVCGRSIDLKARGLDLAVTNGTARLRLRDCTAIVPIGAIQEAINEKIPREWTVDMNKKLSGDEKWRYKNVVAEKVSVHNFQLQDMEPQPPDGVSFTAAGDVDLNGTVEQGKPKDDEARELTWETRPWKLSGYLEGDGTVRYKFLSGTGPLANRVEYNLDMDVPLPSDIKLDWSQVAHGVIGFVERKVIVGHLRKITVPIKYHGTLDIFSRESPFAKNFEISGLVAKRTQDGTEIDFDAIGRF